MLNTAGKAGDAGEASYSNYRVSRRATADHC